jgi:hypothetical protein
MSNESFALFLFGAIALAALVVDSFPHVALLIFVGGLLAALGFDAWMSRSKRKRG